MRGKAGVKADSPKESVEEQSPLVEQDPTAESIAGAENVIDVGEVEETVAALKGTGGYLCSQPGCKFTSPQLSGMEAHQAEAHGIVPQQPELFSPKGVIHKIIEIPLDKEFLDQKRLALAELYQKVLDTKSAKKSADAEFNAELAAFDERMQEIARILQRPYTNDTVDCEWRIIEGENARGLFRLDTGEMIGDKEPLSMEDKIAEEAKAAADNAPKLCKVCNEPATKQTDGKDQFVCDSHLLEGDTLVKELAQA